MVFVALGLNNSVPLVENMVSPEERDAQALQEKIARIKARLAEEKKELPAEAKPVEKPVPPAPFEIEIPVKKAGAPPEAVVPPKPLETAKPGAAKPSQPPAKKPGLFAKLFAPKPRPAKPLPEAKKPPAAKPPAPLPTAPVTPPALAKAELKKAKAKEAELILRDIVGAAEKEAAAAEAAPGGQAPPVHRRYLLKRRERPAAAPSPEQAREKEELAAMAAELYPAFKPVEAPAAKPAEKPVVAKPEKPGRPVPEKKEVARKPEKKPGEAAAPAKALTLEEIIGGAPTPGAPAAPAEAPLFPEAAPPAGGVPLFAELGAITGAPAPKAEEKPAEKPVEKPAEAKAAAECPTCHSKNVKVVFCPYCGAGMCFNCSPLVRPEADAMVYACPKCGEEVTVRKKA
ncbi:MAG: hypothetical protein AB1626_00530 [Candidatus Micrarchaeota archaeon]